MRHWIPLLCLIAAVLFEPNSLNAQVQYFSQNWTEEERQTFYTTTQGSRMMPYDWFLALEVKDSEDSFVETQLPKLGYIANENTTNNPDKLPVGFVLDTHRINGSKHIGLTCAACHTNQIEYEGKTFQIDGGPALADMWGMLDGIDESLKSTADDDEKYKRFETNVLGESATSSDRSKLKREFVAFLASWSEFIEQSRTEHPWGRARLDAFGMIFNRVSAIDLEMPENSRKPDAPVSYPSLWGTSFQSQVQWNGSAKNGNDVERLGRNVGEVLGVFAHAKFRGKDFLEIPRPARTSANRLNLVKLENQLKNLYAPQWTEHLGELDQEKLEAGKALYESNCAKCHEVLAFNEMDTPVEVKMVAVAKVKTDPVMALNAAKGEVSTGSIASLFDGREEVPRGEMLKRLVRLALISPYRDVSDANLFQRLRTDDAFSASEIKAFTRELGFGKTELRGLVEANQSKLKTYYRDLKRAVTALKKSDAPKAAEDVPLNLNLAYKSAPLAGIWATAPYLHNGSVPNLYELLSPVEERSEKFHVGNKEFDSKKVGFVTTEGEGTTEFDTSKRGNSNAGHDMYGTFSEEERWQLVEYLKSL